MIDKKGYWCFDSAANQLYASQHVAFLETVRFLIFFYQVILCFLLSLLVWGCIYYSFSYYYYHRKMQINARFGFQVLFI